MNILSIGNSFSQDAHRYLHGIAKAGGYALSTFNLYIGGCPLSKHYRNMLSEERAYSLEMNGENTGFYVSVKEALLSRDWDVVTVQQQSGRSPRYETYQPYLTKLAEYIRQHCPQAKLVVHQTWAYEEGCKMLADLGYNRRIDMFSGIREAYEKAAQDIKADFLIPSGEVFQNLLSLGVENIHRDTYHASLGVGRYALGLAWYAALTGNDISDNAFSDFDEEVSAREIEAAKKSVKMALEAYGLR